MNPWTIESVITHAKEMTERNGFELLPGKNGVIKIVAKNRLMVETLRLPA
jgi:hypothetical protein